MSDLKGSGFPETLMTPISLAVKFHMEADLPDPLSPIIMTAIPIFLLLLDLDVVLGNKFYAGDFDSVF